MSEEHNNGPNAIGLRCIKDQTINYLDQVWKELLRMYETSITPNDANSSLQSPQTPQVIKNKQNTSNTNETNETKKPDTNASDQTPSKASNSSDSNSISLSAPSTPINTNNNQNESKTAENTKQNEPNTSTTSTTTNNNDNNTQTPTQNSNNDSKSNAWIVNSVLRPHIEFARLQKGTQHAFAIEALKYPHWSHLRDDKLRGLWQEYGILEFLDPKLTNNIRGSVNDIETLTACEYIHDIFLYFYQDCELCSEQLIHLPTSFASKFLVIESIFTKMLLLPHSTHNELFYGRILIELFRKQTKIWPRIVGPVVNRLFHNIENIDIECRDRLAQWFSFHLSNFGFQWPWKNWSLIVNLPKENSKRLFVENVFVKCYHISYYEAFKKTLAEEIVPVLTDSYPKPEPFFIYEQFRHIAPIRDNIESDNNNNSNNDNNESKETIKKEENEDIEMAKNEVKKEKVKEEEEVTKNENKNKNENENENENENDKNIIKKETKELEKEGFIKAKKKENERLRKLGEASKSLNKILNTRLSIEDVMTLLDTEVESPVLETKENVKLLSKFGDYKDFVPLEKIESLYEMKGLCLKFLGNSSKMNELTQLELFFSCILNVGKSSASHVISLLKMYGKGIKTLLNNNKNYYSELRLIDCLFNYWKHSQLRCEIFCDRLHALNYISPINIVKYIFLKENVLKSYQSFYWKILFNSIDRMVKTTFGIQRGIAKFEEDIKELHISMSSDFGDHV